MMNLGWIVADFFNNIWTIALIVVAVLLLILALKYEGSRKLIYFGFCFIVCAGGVFAGIDIYNKMTSTSYSYGAVEYKETYFEALADIDIDVLTLYPSSNGGYSFEDTLEYVDFDGNKNEYQIYVNGTPLNQIETGAGYIEAVYEDFYYGIDNSLEASVILNIRFEFYSSETKFKLTTNLSAEEEGYLQQYIRDNGFKIAIAEKGE